MTTFNVYRRYSKSESPVQIATGLTTKSYSDTDITQGAIALYSIGAVKNGIEKISDEIEVNTRTYHVWLEFSAFGIVKKGTSSVQFNNSGCSFEQMLDGNYAARFQNQNTYLYSSASDAISGDVEIEMVYTFLAVDGFYSAWYDSRSDSLTNGQMIGIYNGGTFIEFRNSSGAGASGGLTTSAHILNQKMKLTWRRIGSVWKYYVDDVFIANLGNSDPYLSDIMQNQVLIGRVKNGDSSYYMNGYLHRWSIRSL